MRSRGPPAHGFWGCAAAPHIDSVLVAASGPVIPQVRGGLPGGRLHDGEVAHRADPQTEDREKIPPEDGGELVLGHHQEVILEGVVLPAPGHPPAVIPISESTADVRYRQSRSG